MDDIMKINVKTKFMKKVVSKLVSKYLSKKLGCEVDIRFNNLDIDMVDGQTKVLTNVELNFKNEDFKKILNGIDPDEEV